MTRRDQTQNLLALRVTLNEAETRAATHQAYGDRVIAILLAGLAAESAVRIALDSEFRAFENALVQLEQQLGGTLAFKSAGSRSWRDRIALQHSGTIGDDASCLASVQGAGVFVREVVARSIGIELDAVSLASSVGMPGLRAALISAEEALRERDQRRATEWIARSLERLKMALGVLSHAQGWDSGFGELDAHRALRDISPAIETWARRIEAEIDRQRLREILRLDPFDLDRVHRTLPHCFTSINNKESVSFATGEPLPTDEELRWAMNVVISAALRLDASRPKLESWQEAALDEPTVVEPDL